LWKLGLFVLLLYGALQLWVRTDSFRTRVEKELSNLVGMEMRVGRIRATESLNLKIRDIISVSDVAGIEIRVARLRWRWFRPTGVSMLESLRVQGLAITIAPDENGVLQPAFLGSLSKQIYDWVGISMPEPAVSPAVAEPPAEAAADAGASVLSAFASMGIGPVSFRDVSIRWQDAEGRLVASVSGLNVARMSMELANGETVAHVDCSVEKVKVERGPSLSGLHLEWLEAAGRWFLVDLSAEDWGSASRPRSLEDEDRALLDSMDQRTVGVAFSGEIE
jgi:hypothetical protein